MIKSLGPKCVTAPSERIVASFNEPPDSNFQGNGVNDLIEETMYDISDEFNRQDLTLNDLISRFELLTDELRTALAAVVKTSLTVTKFRE